VEIGEQALHLLPLLGRQIGKRENSRSAAQNTSFIQMCAFRLDRERRGRGRFFSGDLGGRGRLLAQPGDLGFKPGVGRLAPLEARGDVGQAGA
jgi:hypothetical protein